MMQFSQFLPLALARINQLLWQGEPRFRESLMEFDWLLGTNSLQTMPSIHPLKQLGELFGLTELESDILLLCLAPDLSQAYAELYISLQHDKQANYPKQPLLLNVFGIDLEGQTLIRRALSPQAPLREHKLLCYQDGNFKVNESLMNYLLDYPGLTPKLQNLVQLLTPIKRIDDLVLSADFIAELREITNQTEAPLYLQGQSGKRTLACAIAHERQQNLLVIDLNALLLHPYVEWPALLKQIRLEAKLQNGLIYCAPLDRFLLPENIAYLQALQHYLPVTSILGGETDWQASTVVSVKLGNPDDKQRSRLWRLALSEANLADDGVDILAKRYHLTAKQIKQATHAARYAKEASVAAALSKACQEQQSFQRLAKRIDANWQRNDIVLPPLQSAQLDELIAYVEHYDTVFEQWGFNKKLPRGKGLIALFSGPPGTGKTMAAEVVARCLDLALYRVDLSLIVSKYIGETEKQLSALFEEAAHTDVVLFFDEADSLFAKRSEVQSSNDRYANLETNHLLQLIEQHTGIIILASNYKGNIDEAFLRRLQFSIDFPQPQVSERLVLWQQMWPQGLTISPEVNLHKLAEYLQLSGGHIRNIALTAAFKAAAQGESHINLEHIVHGVLREYKKLGKLSQESELRKFLKE